MVELDANRIKEIRTVKEVGMLEAKRLARKEAMLELFDRTQFLVLDGDRDYHPLILYNMLELLEELIKGED